MALKMLLYDSYSFSSISTRVQSQHRIYLDLQNEKTKEEEEEEIMHMENCVKCTLD